MQYFKTIFLEGADEFISSLDIKTKKKIFYNIRLAEQTNDSELFKKLNNDIWEFRTLYNKLKIRVLAFWDKTDETQVLVIATSGFIKKTQKTPVSEVEKANQIKNTYFKMKQIWNK